MIRSTKILKRAISLIGYLSERSPELDIFTLTKDPVQWLPASLEVSPDFLRFGPQVTFAMFYSHSIILGKLISPNLSFPIFKFGVLIIPASTYWESKDTFPMSPQPSASC